jgi:hypothetical protein
MTIHLKTDVSVNFGSMHSGESALQSDNLPDGQGTVLRTAKLRWPTTMRIVKRQLE